MKHGSLFSGIGGFDLAAEWMGWENIFHCEWNEFGQRVLKHYWPQAISYHDITKTDFSIHRGQIDILTGGFPCQPYSLAGKRKGKEDERHLWPEMLRAIREIKPTWVVGENVFGLVNWSDGLVFEEVCAELEAEGYEVQPFILPAAGVNAPHKRDRVWFVAYSDKTRFQKKRAKQQTTGLKQYRELDGITENTASDGCLCRESEQDGTEDGQQRNTWTGNCDGVCEHEMAGITTNTTGNGLHGKPTEKNKRKREDNKQSGEGWKRTVKGFSNERTITNTDSRRQPGKEHRQEKSIQLTEKGSFNYWQNFPTQSPICIGNDGIPTELDGITFPKWRNESIKAAGNAIVPQVVYQIFKAIEEYNILNSVKKH